MDRLEAMRVFVGVAEAEGFAPAAKRLGMSPPAVTRAVAALEERIGTRLLHRTTRVVRLTEAGSRFLADCRRILLDIDEAEASAAGAHVAPRGRLAVTAPVMFGRLHVMPILLDFLAEHPEVTAHSLLVDRIVDLIDEGFDVAVRIAHLPDSSLAAVRVGAVRFVVCASPDYLARCGRPRTPADLAPLDAIDFSPTLTPQPWTFRSGSKALAISPPTQLMVNIADAAIAAAVAGQGLIRVLSYQIAPQLQSGELEIVLAEFELPPVPIQIVHLEGRRAAARVRLFVDYAAKRLRADKSLHG